MHTLLISAQCVLQLVINLRRQAGIVFGVIINVTRQCPNEFQNG